MKKELGVLGMIVGTQFIVSSLALADTTYVSGVIDTNTVWDTTGSPYIVIGNVLVNNSSVTLNIEPGVEVRLDSAKSIIINGILNAIGTVTDSIIISALDTTKRWSRLLFKPTSVCSLKYCRIEYAGNSAIDDEWSHSLYIGYNTITNNSTSWGDGGGIHSYDGSPIITNNIISDNSADDGYGGGCSIYSEYGSPIITNNIISNNFAAYGGGGICSSGSHTISNNTITNNSTSGGGGGICSYRGSPTIKYNTITDTTASAIYIHSDSTLIHRNNFYTTGYAVYNNSAKDIDARYNYWGTTDSTTIANQKIWDFYDNPAKGMVYFWPFLPDSFGQLSIYPNPSFGNPVIRYILLKKADISLKLYDISGRLVKTLYSGTQEAGYYEVGALNLTPLQSGIYFIQLRSDEFIVTRKLIILR